LFYLEMCPVRPILLQDATFTLAVSMFRMFAK
jgi:hypothetical protein